MNRYLRQLPLGLLISLPLLMVIAHAQRMPMRITQKIDDNARTTIPGTTHPAVRISRDLGALSGDHPLRRMMLVLKNSEQQQTALQRLLDSQQNKNSPNYHKWLKPADYATRFGPSDEDLAQVVGWLGKQGFEIGNVPEGRQWIEFSGTEKHVERAFRTSIHALEHNGERHVGNTSDVSLPTALMPVVSGVLSLHDYRKQPTLVNYKVARNSQNKLLPVDPNWTYIDDSGNISYYVAPEDFQKIYDVSPLLNTGNDGTGVSIAVIGRSDINLTDVQAFRNIFGLPENDPNFIVSGADPGVTFGGDMVESSLDVEWSGAAAPGATINFVVAGSTDVTDGIDLAAAYAVDHVISPIITSSYGLCEGLLGATGNQFYNAIWEQAAAEGITVFVSAGDAGAAQCDGNLQQAGYEPQGPALNGPTINGTSSTPYNISIGGTQFNEGVNVATYWSLNDDSVQGSAYGYIPEQIWNLSCDPTLPPEGGNCSYGQTNYNLAGGGGGPSNCTTGTWDGAETVTCSGGYPKPSWQTGLGVPKDGKRDTPDLSLNASPVDDGYAFCVMSSCQTTIFNNQTILEQAAIAGGTSVSTPAMAGLMALVEQKNGTFLGQANYVFYKLAALDNRNACNSSKRTHPSKLSVCIFNDVTDGNNGVPGLPGYRTTSAEWSAGKGYDMASGLGSVNAANLVANWSKVAFQGSSTTIIDSTTRIAHGQPLTVKVSVAAVDGGGSTPSGDFSLMTSKYGAVGQGTLDVSGTFSGAFNSLPGGTYALTAQYAGDGNLGGSTSAPVKLTVTPEDSAVSFRLYVDNFGQLTPLNSSTTFGSTIAVVINVTSNSGHGSPTGSVNIVANKDTILSTAPLNEDGTALVLSGAGYPFSLPAGTHNVSVQYSGDNSFLASTSAQTRYTLLKGLTETFARSSLGGSEGQVAAGQPVILMATVAYDGTPHATGTLQFFDNGSPLSGPLPIAYNGPIGVGYAQAIYTSTFTTTGNHVITAGYSGDAKYQPVDPTGPNAVSFATITVDANSGASSVVKISQIPGTIYFGQGLSYVVNVAPTTEAGPMPTGQVWVYSDGNISGMGTLANGQVTIAEPQLGAGICKVYAYYLGDSTYAASTSQIITTKVLRRTPVVTLTTPDAHVFPGAETSLNFVAQAYVYNQYGAIAPSGTVEFLDSVNGGSPQSLGTYNLVGLNINSGWSERVILPKGTNIVTARYSGDDYFNPTPTAAVTVVVSSTQRP